MYLDITGPEMRKSQKRNITPKLNQIGLFQL